MSLLRLVKLFSNTKNLNGDDAIRVVLTTAASDDLTAPTDIELSNQSITSGSDVGSVVGSLSTINGTAPYTYSITTDVDNKFDISESTLITDATVTTVTTHNVTIMVTDANSNTFSKSFTISVTAAPSYANEFSLSFNGVDERVETDFSFGGRTEFTINTYMYRSSTSHRFDISQTNSGNNVRVKLIRNNNDEIIVVIDGDTASYDDSSTGWLMITMVFDGSQSTGSRVKMYINGVLASANGTVSFPSSVAANSEKTCLGYDLGSNRFSTGNIDETSFFDSPLNQTEVTELYNSGTPLDLTLFSKYSDVLAWYRCGESLSSPNMPDQVGSFNGTLENMDASNKDTNTP